MNRAARRKLVRVGPHGLDHVARPHPLAMLMLDDELHDDKGALRVRPSVVHAEIEAALGRDAIKVWCHLNAYYCLPTTELVEWLHAMIGGRSAIEIGSGNGALGRALGIPRTDSMHQTEDPMIARFYREFGQPTVRYGADVERLEAMEAVEKYEPEVVIAAWVTHWIDPRLPMPKGGGSIQGIREDRLLAFPSVQTYCVVGNAAVHGIKPIWKHPHTKTRAEWLRSRSRDPSKDTIYTWNRETT